MRWIKKQKKFCKYRLENLLIRTISHICNIVINKLKAYYFSDDGIKARKIKLLTTRIEEGTLDSPS